MPENQQPLIAIDVAALHFDGTKLKVALGERKFDPFKGEHALPGVLLLPGETLKEATLRALETKVGYTKDNTYPIEQVGAYDNSDRDPRGPTISILSYGIIREPDNKAGSILSPVEDLPKLPFDHNELIKAAVQRLAQTALTDKETFSSLLGETFTTAEAWNLIDQLNITMNKTNLARFLRSTPFIKESETTVTVPGQKGRPTKLWSIK